jgi:hypothetical protein
MKLTNHSEARQARRRESGAGETSSWERSLAVAAMTVGVGSEIAQVEVILTLILMES